MLLTIFLPTGLIELMRKKVEIERHRIRPLASIRFTYMLTEWPEEACWSQAPPDLDLDLTIGGTGGLDYSGLEQLPFGLLYDPVRYWLGLLLKRCNKDILCLLLKCQNIYSFNLLQFVSFCWIRIYRHTMGIYLLHSTSSYYVSRITPGDILFLPWPCFLSNTYVLYTIRMGFNVN